jgi:hypothetical protein
MVNPLCPEPMATVMYSLLIWFVFIAQYTK